MPHAEGVARRRRHVIAEHEKGEASEMPSVAVPPRRRRGTRHRRCRVLQSPHAEGVHAEGVKETLNPEPVPKAGLRHAEGVASVVRQGISTLVLPDHPLG